MLKEGSIFSIHFTRWSPLSLKERESHTQDALRHRGVLSSVGPNIEPTLNPRVHRMCHHTGICQANCFYVFPWRCECEVMQLVLKNVKEDTHLNKWYPSKYLFWEITHIFCHCSNNYLDFFCGRRWKSNWRLQNCFMST